MKKLKYVDKQSSIYGMSFPRDLCLNKMKSLSKTLNRHIIECVVYSLQRYQDVQHWVGEICTWINKVNKIKCSSQLKPENYMDTLFREFGTDRLDADVNLDEYHDTNVAYPDFEITDDMIDKLYRVYQLIEHECIPVFISKEVKTKQEWYNILLPKIQEIIYS